MQHHKTNFTKHYYLLKYEFIEFLVVFFVNNYYLRNSLIIAATK